MLNRAFVCVVCVIAVCACGGGTKEGASKASASANPPPPLPPLESAPNAKIMESSVYQTYGASGLLRAVPPGWHVLVSALPQSVEIDFEQEQTLTKMSLLPQDGFAVRAPKNVALEVMNAKGWMEVLRVEDACQGAENKWRTFPLNEPQKATQVRLVINSNCGDPGLVTLRGLTF